MLLGIGLRNLKVEGVYRGTKLKKQVSLVLKLII